MLAELQQIVDTAHDDDVIFLYKSALNEGLAGGIFLEDLPTDDPAVDGQLWNDAGTPAISGS